MNATSLIGLALLYFKLNSGQSAQAGAILKEGMDVINALATAMKDKQITNAEKKVIVKELREFSKVSIKMLDEITLHK